MPHYTGHTYRSQVSFTGDMSHSTGHMLQKAIFTGLGFCLQVISQILKVLGYILEVVGHINRSHLQVVSCKSEIVGYIIEVVSCIYRSKATNKGHRICRR